MTASPLVPVILGLLGALAAEAPAQHTIRDLGQVVGHPGAFAFDVSADGGVVAGRAGPEQDTVGFRWAAADGMSALPGVDGRPATGIAYGVSGDGAVTVGALAGRAARWAPGGAALLPMPAGAALSSAAAANDDGSVVAGFFMHDAGHSEAFRWTAAGGTIALGALERMETFAEGVSGDGSVVVGNANRNLRTAFRWTAATGMQALPRPAGLVGETTAYDVSRDGTTVVGGAGTAGTINRAVRWVGRAPHLLGDLGGADGLAYAAGVSADGGVVVGSAPSPREPSGEAFVWDESGGMRSVADELAANGVDVNGWTFYSAEAVSDDGNTVVGWGSHGGNVVAWMATVPEPAALGWVALAAPLVAPRRARR